MARSIAWMTRRRVLKSSAGAFTAVAAGLGSAAADEAAETYVAGILNEANAYAGENEQARLDAIERLVDQYVDMERVSRFVLGQYARRLNDRQITEYRPLFRNYATLVYQKVLSEYSGEILEVSDSVDRSERDIIVNSRVANARPGDRFANLTVHWRVYRSRDGAMSIVDAGADGVWLAIEQRGQFTSIIANNGGGEAGIDALIAELRTRVAGS